MRVCDGAGITRLVACGITPYPPQGPTDERRGPVIARAERELRKTALAAYDHVHIEHAPTVADALAKLRTDATAIVAVEAVSDTPGPWESHFLDRRPLALLFG